MANFINLTTLAEKLSLSTQTVTKMVRTGELPQPVLIGRHQRWDFNDVETFLKQKGVEAVANE
jgi:excisionase family DNA binding protein